MALVIRGINAYLYRSVRRDGKVRCEYVMSGPDAELIGRLEADLRDFRRDERAEWARLDGIARAQAERFGMMDALVRLALEAAGFHRPKRGPWRRRRIRSMGEPSDSTPAVVPASPPRPRPPAPLAEILDLLQRGARGDESAVPRLREILRADPERMIPITGAALAGKVEEYAIRGLAGKENLTLAEGIHLAMERLRAELAGGPGASTIERLLAERVALCWLDVHSWDIRHSDAEAGASRYSGGGLSPAWHDHYQKQRERAHRRYLLALKTLAQVQRLCPAIQINLARNQVNVAGGPAAPDPPG